MWWVRSSLCAGERYTFMVETQNISPLDFHSFINERARCRVRQIANNIDSTTSQAKHVASGQLDSSKQNPSVLKISSWAKFSADTVRQKRIIGTYSSCCDPALNLLPRHLRGREVTKSCALSCPLGPSYHVVRLRSCASARWTLRQAFRAIRPWDMSRTACKTSA